MFTRPWPAGCLGCFGYFLAFLLVGAVAGFGGLVVPFFVAAFTALMLAACFVVGLLLRVPPVRRLWERGPMLAVLTLTMGIALFLFGLWSIEKLPPLPEGLDPDGQSLPTPGTTTFPGLALAVFAVAHWPVRRVTSVITPPA